MFGTDPLDVFPAQARQKFTPGHHAATDVALGNIALTPTVERHVDRQAEGLVTGLDRLTDHVVDPACIAVHIQLKDTQSFGRCLRHRLHAGRAHRTEHVRNLIALRRLGRCRRSLSREEFQAADRCHHQWQSQCAAQKMRGWVDVADIAQHARTERDRVQRHPIALQGGLGLGAPDDVIPIVQRQFLTRFFHQFMQGQEGR